MTKRTVSYSTFLLCFLIILLIFPSCKSSSITSYKLTGDSTPQKTFEEVNKAIIKGDIEKVYSYLSINQRRIITLEELKQAYEKNKQVWIDQAKNAKIIYLPAIDEKEGKASVIIEWGLGNRTLATFIFEDGIWKEDIFFMLEKR